MNKKRAFISVCDTTEIINFTQKLINYGYEIISTGKTASYLKNNNINIIENSPEDVILAIKTDKSNPDEVNDLKIKNLYPIDIVVCNISSFQDFSYNDSIEITNLIENINTAEAAYLRAAAKNYFNIASVYTPRIYDKLIKDLEENNGITSYDYRKELAVNTFKELSLYDSSVSNELQKRILTTQNMPEVFSLNLEKYCDLQYGENPHQSAALYKKANDVEFEILQGNQLSYNNLTDIKTAFDIISEFIDIPAVCFIKHNNPSGVALGKNIPDAFIKALNCDPVASFGAVVGFNEQVTLETAKYIKDLQLEVIVAPDFSEDALNMLSLKNNLKIVQISEDLLRYKFTQSIDIKQLPFGTVVQTTDRAELSKDNFKTVTKKKPTAEQVEDMVFAWKIVKHVKSNAIIIVKDKRLLGIGSGQTSCIAALDIALNQSCEETKEAIIASDGYLPSIDAIHAAAQSRIAAIIQPGGAEKDDQVIKEADKYDITMICTNQRHLSR